MDGHPDHVSPNAHDEAVAWERFRRGVPASFRVRRRGSRTGCPDGRAVPRDVPAVAGGPAPVAAAAAGGRPKRGPSELRAAAGQCGHTRLTRMAPRYLAACLLGLP